jgi:hypothetical protein
MIHHEFVQQHGEQLASQGTMNLKLAGTPSGGSPSGLLGCVSA